MLGASLCLKKRSYPTTAMTPEIYTILAGIRIRIDNQTINGRVYDLLASHQGDGVWRIDRVAGSTEVPTGGGTDTLGFTITVQDVDNGDPVMIPDAVLRSAIEAQLGKAQGAPIYKIEMQSLETFDPGWLDGIGGIRDLAGLQFATNLEELRLQSNHHTVASTPSLSPLAGLTKLTRLNLAAFDYIHRDPRTQPAGSRGQCSLQ